jgi:superfamily II DNA or RNA helicase
MSRARVSASRKPSKDKPAKGGVGKGKKTTEPRLSRQRRPQAMVIDEWQRALRRQFGREQNFELENLADEPVFSEFRVHNPATGGRYRVAIRGTEPGENYCACLDFATNDLGTCKHVEFTLGRLLARRGGRAALARGYTPAFSEVYLHYGAQRTVRFRAGGECPPALLAKARALFDAAAGWILLPTELARLDAFIGAARASSHELRVYDDALAFVAQIRDTEHRRRVLAEAYPKGARDKALAKLVKTRLYPYQAEGALFAARAGRALIADEMGLGKTVQAIAAAEIMARHFGVQRVLVVCPTSPKHQWQREVARFSGRGSDVVSGLRAAREQQWRAEAFCKITSYETLDRDADLIEAWAPELLIVDEAQRVKNWNTIAARALKRINTPYALVLTGTPLENRLQELIAIVQLVDQHRLGPTWRLLHEHQEVDEAGRVVGYRSLDRIGTTLAPILLRRRKAEVLVQLPERVDKTLFVPLTHEQRIHHDENGDIVARIVARWRKTGYLSDVDQRRLTCALQNMRMACNSTWLLDRETDHGTKADEAMAVLEELFEQPEAKAAIFSQWIGTHEVLTRRLGERGWGHVLFHGGVPGEKRGALVDRFVNDPQCRLFLSTDAGGVGLNLQHAAATVINMDLPWNPAVLEQRIGRVHRMGQRHGVRVINFVAQGSIEEGMLSVLAFKKSMFAGVLDGGDGTVFMNGTRLAKFMETVHKVTGTMGVAEEALAPVQEGAPIGARAQAAQQPAKQLMAEHRPAALAAAAETSSDGGLPEPAAMAGQARSEPDRPPAGSAPLDPWAPLLDAGLRLVESLAAAGRDGDSDWVHTDANTGRRYLKLPLPEPDAVQRLAEGLKDLLAGVRR